MSNEEKPTVEMDKVPPWAIELTKATKEGFKLTNANLEVVANDLGVVKERVTILENERTKLSGGVRGLSTSNAEQDAQLAQERAAREALALEVAELKKTNEAQLAILARLDKVAANPTVKMILFALGIVITGWLASKGVAVK